MVSPLLERWSAHAASPRLAIVDALGAHDYRSIDDLSRRLALALLSGKASLGGERVALLISPGAAFVSAFFAVLMAGGTVVVLSPLYPPRETRYFCEDAGVSTLLTSSELASHAAPIADGKRVFYTEDPGEDRRLERPAELGSDSPALQLYTSGTTGRPKGAVLTHGNIATQQSLLHEAWGWSQDDVLLHALPLHHMHGLAIALLPCLGAGACARMVPFEAGRIWEELGQATVFMAVPSMVQRLEVAFRAAGPEARARWSRGARGLRLATSGSAALPVTLGEFWRELTGQYPLERFGMTEIGVGLTNPLVGERHPGCVGAPLPTVEARIVDEQGEDGLMGELWIRGPSVFSGYHLRSEETARAFARDPGGGAPWFRTGDTVTRQGGPGGPFKILGRTSVDILKSGGYKLSALEIEEVLRECPSVLDAAVVGVADEAWGDRVVACVIPRPGAEGECTEEALRAFVRERLAPYKVPKTVRIMESFPRNPMGKVLKPELARDLSSTLSRT